MHRRLFIHNMLQALQGLVLMRWAWPAALEAAIGDMDADRRHYRPLDGRRLRDLALQKVHHGPGRFVNPLGFPRQGRFWQLLKWKLSPNRFETHLKDQPVSPVSVDWQALRAHQKLSVTFLKHASVLIKDQGHYLLIDPLFGNLPWVGDDFSPLTFDLDQMPAIDDVLITHGHYDHLDTPSLAALPAETHVISPLGYQQVFKGLKMNNRTQLDWYDTCSYRGGAITLLPTHHWTMRSPLRGPNRSLWGGYLLQTAGGYTIYFMGDSGYFDGFAEIGSDFDIDLVIINLGAYEPRWFMAPSHMNPPEAVKAFKQLNADRLMAVHWGTFRLGDEPVHFPPEGLKQALAKEGLLDCLIDIRHGQTFFVD